MSSLISKAENWITLSRLRDEVNAFESSKRRILLKRRGSLNLFIITEIYDLLLSFVYQ